MRQHEVAVLPDGSTEGQLIEVGVGDVSQVGRLFVLVPGVDEMAVLACQLRAHLSIAMIDVGLLRASVEAWRRRAGASLSLMQSGWRVTSLGLQTGAPVVAFSRDSAMAIEVMSGFEFAWDLATSPHVGSTVPVLVAHEYRAR